MTGSPAAERSQDATEYSISEAGSLGSLTTCWRVALRQGRASHPSLTTLRSIKHT